MEALTIQEVQDLMDATDPYSVLGSYVRIGYYTGLRVSEALSITVGDIAVYADGVGKLGENGIPNYIIKKTLYINPARLKGGKSATKTIKPRSIHLDDNLRKWFAELLEKSTQTPRPLKRTTDKLFEIKPRRIQQLIKALFASLPSTQGRRLSTHSLRKSYAIHAYNLSDKNLSLVQHLLGHSSIASTGVYLAAQIYPVSDIQAKIQSGVDGFK